MWVVCQCREVWCGAWADVRIHISNVCSCISQLCACVRLCACVCVRASPTGIMRVTIKKSKSILFVIARPEVFKFPNADTYVIYGEAKIEDMSAQVCILADLLCICACLARAVCLVARAWLCEPVVFGVREGALMTRSEGVSAWCAVVRSLSCTPQMFIAQAPRVHTVATLPPISSVSLPLPFHARTLPTHHINTTGAEPGSRAVPHSGGVRRPLHGLFRQHHGCSNR